MVGMASNPRQSLRDDVTEIMAIKQSPSPKPAKGHAAPEQHSAAEYWDGVLDPQNLERDERTGSDFLTLTDEIEFARTPDLEAARCWFDQSPKAPRWILDLGAGLGANSFAMATRGHRMVALDTSLNRLRSLRQRAETLGCADRIDLVVSQAEALPFKDHSVPAIYTKSVLIHTDLPRSAAEIGRTLAEGGRAALFEPQPGNPFAVAYRRWLAPKSWASITRYFSREEQDIYLRTFVPDHPYERVRHFYLFSFLAFVFQFAWPNLKWFRRTLRLLNPLDRWLFRHFKCLHKRAWFGMIRIEKPLPPHK